MDFQGSDKIFLLGAFVFLLAEHLIFKRENEFLFYTINQRKMADYLPQSCFEAYRRSLSQAIQPIQPEICLSSLDKVRKARFTFDNLENLLDLVFMVIKDFHSTTLQKYAATRL